MARPLVLLIEDDDDMRAILEEILDHEGYAAIGACDGPRALRMLEEGARPDVILLDMILPGMEGADVLSAIRSREAHAGTPVVVLSALLDPPPRGANGVLRKPFRIPDLLQCLAKLGVAGGAR